MLLIRADANEMIGTGHMMRCISIAEEFRGRGEAVTFIAADECSGKIAASKGFPVICLHSVWNDLERELDRLIDTVQRYDISLLLIDSYYVTEFYLKQLRQYTRIAYIDDVDAFLYPADLLINYNMYAESLDYPAKYRKAGMKTQFALGCSYAPLRKEFSNTSRNTKEQVSDILITSGGTDPYHVTGSILDKLAEQPWFMQMHYYVILGRFHMDQSELEEKWKDCGHVHLLKNVSNMSDYMKSCDVAITAGGVTVYELCACGIPSILYTLADNQLRIAQAVSERRLIPWVGDVRENMRECMDSIVEHLEMYVSDREKRRQLSVRMRECVDGNGSRRLADRMNQIICR